MNNNPQIQEINHLIRSLCADDCNALLNQMNIDEKVINQAANALHRIIFREKPIRMSSNTDTQAEVDKGIWTSIQDGPCLIRIVQLLDEPKKPTNFGKDTSS